MYLDPLVSSSFGTQIGCRDVSHTSNGANVPPVFVRICKHILSADFDAAIQFAYCMLDHISLATHIVAATWKNERRGDPPTFDHLNLVIIRPKPINAAYEWRDIVAELIV